MVAGDENDGPARYASTGRCDRRSWHSLRQRMASEIAEVDQLVAQCRGATPQETAAAPSGQISGPVLPTKAPSETSSAYIATLSTSLSPSEAATCALPLTEVAALPFEEKRRPCLKSFSAQATTWPLSVSDTAVQPLQMPKPQTKSHRLKSLPVAPPQACALPVIEAALKTVQEPEPQKRWPYLKSVQERTTASGLAVMEVVLEPVARPKPEKRRSSFNSFSAPATACPLPVKEVPEQPLQDRKPEQRLPRFNSLPVAPPQASVLPVTQVAVEPAQKRTPHKRWPCLKPSQLRAAPSALPMIEEVVEPVAEPIPERRRPRLTLLEEQATAWPLPVTGAAVQPLQEPKPHKRSFPLKSLPVAPSRASVLPVTEVAVQPVQEPKQESSFSNLSSVPAQTATCGLRVPEAVLPLAQGPPPQVVRRFKPRRPTFKEELTAICEACVSRWAEMCEHLRAEQHCRMVQFIDDCNAFMAREWKRDRHAQLVHMMAEEGRKLVAHMYQLFCARCGNPDGWCAAYLKEELNKTRWATGNNDQSHTKAAVFQFEIVGALPALVERACDRSAVVWRALMRQCAAELDAALNIRRAQE